MEPVNLWNEIGTAFGEMLQRILLWTRATVLAHAPGFLSALLVLALGWITASLLRNITAKLLRAGGLDVVAERSGLRDYLRRHDVMIAPSAIIGRVLYFVIIFTALLMAVDRLNFQTAAQWLHTIADFLPRLLVFVVLLALGSWSARWIGSLVGRAARLGGVPFHALIGTTVRLAIIVLAVIVGLDYLDLASPQTMLVTLAVLLGAGLCALGLFALCARELVGGMLAKNYVLAEYKPGDRILLDGVDGEIESIGGTVVRVRGPHGLSLVPHTRLLRDTATIQRTPPTAGPATNA